MKTTGSKKLQALTEVGIILCLVALLVSAPACSFIEELLGGGEDTVQADGGAATADTATATNVPQPPPIVPPPGTPDAAAAIAAAMQNMPDGGLPPGFDPSKLPPGIDSSQLPPGFDPSKLPPGFDPTKIPDGGLPPGIDPTKIPDGGLPPGIDPSKLPPGIDPSQLAGLDPSKLPPGVDPADLASGALPPGADPSAMAALSSLTPEQHTQLQEASAARNKLTGQIRRLDYIIDRNLTKNPADVVRLNRYVRAKRELDAQLESMRKQHNIPREVFQNMLNSGAAESSEE